MTFDLAQQPNKMPFNDKATPADSLEYEWGVYVDADGSGDAQYEVCLVHFKGKGARATSDTLENQCDGEAGISKPARCDASDLARQAPAATHANR